MDTKDSPATERGRPDRTQATGRHRAVDSGDGWFEVIAFGLGCALIVLLCYVLW